MEQRYTIHFIICSRHNQIPSKKTTNRRLYGFKEWLPMPSFTVCPTWNILMVSNASNFWELWILRTFNSNASLIKMKSISSFMSNVTYNFISYRVVKCYKKSFLTKRWRSLYLYSFFTLYIVSEIEYMTEKRIIFFFKYFRLGH